MASFAERYGYRKASEIIIREDFPKCIQNSTLNWLDTIETMNGDAYKILQMSFWLYFANEDIKDFELQQRLREDFLRDYIKDKSIAWFDKLNLIEFILNFIQVQIHSDEDYYEEDYNKIVLQLNDEFERHNYAYRIVGNQIEEITSEFEIAAIETAISDSAETVKHHIQTALEHLSASNQQPDYRASIKESISAVEAYCRDITGETTLGKALDKMAGAGLSIPPSLKVAFEKLYVYTNDSKAGIRHALMDETQTYSPTSAESIFMLVSCSAFINYLIKKLS